MRLEALGQCSIYLYFSEAPLDWIVSFFCTVPRELYKARRFLGPSMHEVTGYRTGKRAEAKRGVRPNLMG